MKELINSFSDMLNDAIAIGSSAPVAQVETKINQVVIAGMGGSGIGGKIVSQIFAPESHIPIIANGDYTLPAFANENTLLIISSYSGNTEETLSAMQVGMERGCQIACVTSGGKVKELADANGYYKIEIPGGNPPRAMFPYSMVQQLYILQAFGIIGDSFEGKLKKAVELIVENKTAIMEEAKHVCDRVHGRIPLVYSDDWLSGVGIRWCQQMNENSKSLCWSNPFPEMNHNELVGWEGGDNRVGVIMMRSAFDTERSARRMDICEPIFKKKNDTVLQIQAKGDSTLEAMLYLVVFGDWLSWYLSVANGADAVAIDNIDYLKNKLSEF